MGKYPIWEALPHDKRNVREIITTVAHSLGVDFRFKSIPSAVLNEQLPSDLEREPLWREFAMNITEANIFNAINVKPKPFGELSGEPLSREFYLDSHRVLECEFLKDVAHD